MKPKPKIGQTVYSLNVGNRAGRGVERKLTPMVVTKVGRKYFTASQDIYHVDFHLDSWKQVTEYTPIHKLYITKQDWQDEKEEAQLCEVISSYFEYNRNPQNLPLQKLRAIMEILNQPE